MNEGFRDAFALVTGASSGIGEVFARELAARGANLLVTARSRDKLEVLAAELAKAHDVEVHVVAADLGEPSGVERLCREADELGIPVDHLVNNAGFGAVGAFAGADPAVQTDMVRLNCEALMRVTRHFLPPMLARGRGGVIHVASTAAYQPMPYMATYGATKAFVLSFSLALSEEVAGRGVSVMALCPGPVPTGFQAVAGIEPGMERIAALSAEQTVKRGLEAYLAGDRVCVPGTVNRAQTLASKLLPRGVVTHTISAAMKRMGRAK
jgi:uncharacterized protein